MKKIYTSSIFVNFVNFANFAKFATGYFARIAAVLLMLVTMSVGEVWADVTIHYSNPNNWSNPHCYAWGNGVSMTWNNNDGMTANPNNPGWWDKTMTTCPGNVIFHNGSGTQYDAGAPSGTEMWYTSTGNGVPSTTAPAGWSTGAPVKRCVAHNRVLNSKSWNPSGDEMTLIDGVYTITFENVPAQQVKFKITDGTWSNSWNSVDAGNSNVETSTDSDGNVQFTLSATNDVTITFNDNTKKITVNTPVAPETKYAVTVSAGAGGSVSPNGNRSVGASGITITATPDAEYTFVRWDVTGGAAVASTTAASTTLTATADGMVTAVFAPESLTMTYCLRGFGDFTNNKYYFVKESAGAVEGSYDLVLTAGNHTFKVYEDGDTWYGNNGTMTRENCTNWTMSTGADNCTITADVAGTYRFTFNQDTKELSVTYPCKPTGWTIDFIYDAVEDMPMVDNGDGTFKLTFYISNDIRLFRVTDGCRTYTIDATKDAYGKPLSGQLVESTYKMGYDGGLMNFVTATIDGDNNFTLGAATAEDLNLALSAEIENPNREPGSSAIHFQNIVAKVPVGLNVKIAVYELETASASGNKKQTFKTDLAVNATEYTTAAQTFEAGHTYYYCLALFQEGRPQVYSQVLTITTPAPEITSIAVSPAHPTAGETVTVTPTIAHTTGSEVLCWSVVDQSIDFTDNGDRTYSFTAPADGSYQIKLELHDGGCDGTLFDEATQPLRVGAFIIIYAGMEAGWHDWSGIKACVGNGPTGTEDHTALVGVDLGEASDGRHWFQFTLPTTDTHESLVLYNSVDEWPSTTIGSARTATLPKPTEDICYLVRGEMILFGNRRVDVGECPSEASVMITSSNHVVKDGTYTITARTILIPGTVTYSYTVTDPSGNDVAVSGDGKFTANSTGTYHVTVRATGDGGISAISDVKEVVCEAASVTASVDPTSGIFVGGKVTLSAATTGFDNPTYQWFVQYPSTGTWLAISGFTEKSGNYTVSKEGTYTFKVQVTEDGHMVESSTCTSTVSSQTYYIKYRNAGDDAYDWAWHEMTFNSADGTYYYNYGYWNAGASGVNTNTAASDDNKILHAKADIEFVGLESTESMAVRYVFDGSSVKAINSSLTYYRVRSVCGDKTYYSNEVSPTAEGVDISFYAQQTGTIFLEKLEGGAWVKGGDFGAAGSGQLDQSSITADGVYTAKITTSTTSTGNLALVAMYTGDFYIFSEVSYKNECRTENRMTKFNNISADEYYNHYWCVWVNDDHNTGATVGNAINHNLANALSRDVVNKMSVRYAYHPTTNHFSRAYLRGSAAKDGYDDCFLKVFGTNVSNEDGSVKYTNTTNGLSFNDGSNWVYTATIYGSAPATIKLAACLDKAGAGTWDYLLSPTGSADYARNIYDQVDGQDVGPLRFYVSYDFKTNRCIAAWYPDGEDFDHMVTVDADLIVIRNAINGSSINMFTLSGEGGVKLIRKIYTAIELNRDDIFESSAPHNYKSGLNKRLFQLSLPYNLDLLDVTGFLDYGTKMNLQVYSGELRALLGWQTYIETFWSNMAYQSSSKIQAQRGYVIQHSLAYDDFKTFGEGLAQVSRITLYFPSQTNPEGHIIGPTSRYGTSAFAPLTCTKPGRDKIDSNWRCIGLPGFYPASAVAVDPETIPGGTNDPATNIVTEFVTPRWVYDWNGSYMSYTAYRATNFRFMPTQNYMMQYAGSITWGDAVDSNSDGTTDYPSVESPVAARHAAVSEQSEGEYCLRLTDESGEMLDQTFVVLDHKASDAYEMNMDLQKMVTNGAPQIYSVAGGQTLAAAAVCDTTTRVALGTNLPDGALYTFSLGEMTPNARVPYLYDAMTGTYTNLATDSYVFSETIGKQQGRFFLVFGYQAPQTPTGLDNVVNGFSATIVDGRVVLNGLTNDLVSLYDAAGRLLYEQHLGGNNTIALPMVGGVYMVRNGANTTKIVIR